MRELGRSSAEPGGGVELEAETMLPGQFSPGFRIGADIQPEKRLMLAVLEEAVSTFQNHGLDERGHGRRLFADAEAWFASGDTQWAYSFLNICNALGLESSSLRAGLGQWRDRQRQRTRAGERAARVMFRRMNGPRHSTTGRHGTLQRRSA
jgi:hypothetical protein